MEGLFEVLVFSRILLRRSSLAILAIGLLVAVIVSMNCIVNYMDVEFQALSRLVNIGGTYLILSGNSTSITDSKLDSIVLEEINCLVDVQHIFPQRVLRSELISNSTILPVYVRYVGDIEGFLKFRNAYINGVVARVFGEVNVGGVLAEIAGISLHDRLNITIEDNILQFNVVGIFITRTGLDAEVIIPLGEINISNGKLSMIEFSFKSGVDEGRVLSYLANYLPNVKVFKVQQLNEFISEVNSQTLRFMNILSLTIYVIVAIAFYIITVRLTSESIYELAMLKALGAGRKQIFSLVLASIIVVALLGLILGVSLGIVGIQVAATMVRWIMLIDITPFLQFNQILQILLLTFTSSIIGCLHPAYKATCMISRESL